AAAQIHELEQRISSPDAESKAPINVAIANGDDAQQGRTVEQVEVSAISTQAEHLQKIWNRHDAEIAFHDSLPPRLREMRTTCPMMLTGSTEVEAMDDM